MTFRKTKIEEDYEVSFSDFKDTRLDEYCCYCFGYRAQGNTTLDHVPSKGALISPDDPVLPTVRVCQECNRSWSPIEQYASCTLSAFISGSHKHDLQILPKAKKILRSDKRLRKRIFDDMHYDARGRAYWRPSSKEFDTFLLKQAMGHFFLETGELLVNHKVKVDWFVIHQYNRDGIARLKERTSDVFPELGSRSFIRLIDDYSISDGQKENDENFIEVEAGSYKYRIVQCSGFNEVQTVLHERIFTSISWETF